MVNPASQRRARTPVAPCWRMNGIACQNLKSRVREQAIGPNGLLTGPWPRSASRADGRGRPSFHAGRRRIDGIPAFLAHRNSALDCLADLLGDQRAECCTNADPRTVSWAHVHPGRPGIRRDAHLLSLLQTRVSWKT